MQMTYITKFESIVLHYERAYKRAKTDKILEKVSTLDYNSRIDFQGGLYGRGVKGFSTIKFAGRQHSI